MAGAAGLVAVRHLISSGSAPGPRLAAPGPAAATAPGQLAADPFAGSPADSFADGAAGIVPPAAHAVGSYSRAQVRHAYAMTRRLLIAADLNQPTLAGDSPRAFARLLTSRQRHIFTTHLTRTKPTKHGGSRSTRQWLATFAPGSAQLAGNVIKVRGAMRASAATDPGPNPVLRITLDYLFVYPLQRPGQPATRTRVIVRDTHWIDFGHWQHPTGPLQPWWLVTTSTAGAQCGTSDGYIHTYFPQSPTGRTRPSGKPVDPYNQSLPPPNGCHPTTRT